MFILIYVLGNYYLIYLFSINRAWVWTKTTVMSTGLQALGMDSENGHVDQPHVTEKTAAGQRRKQVSILSI